MRTALRLKVARGEITIAEQSQSFSAFDSDLQSGFFEAPQVVNWPSIFARTESISQQFAATTFCRTLDILHIAIALEQGMTEFCSFDGRQRDLAQRCGLNVVP